MVFTSEIIFFILYDVKAAKSSVFFGKFAVLAGYGITAGGRL